MRLLVIGNGRMGRLVANLAPSHGFTVAGVLDGRTNAGGGAIAPNCAAGVDVAIEFTTPGAVADNLRALAAAGVNAVVGTTGWREHEARLRADVAVAGIGVVAAANFSLGAMLLEAAACRVIELLKTHDEYGAWVHEHHHGAKKDAPSGTALALVEALRHVDATRAFDMASTRAGHAPGTHTVGVDGPAEQVTLTHLVRDRSTFAHGALVAARWIIGRQGWFTMRDVVGGGPLAH